MRKRGTVGKVVVAGIKLRPEHLGVNVEGEAGERTRSRRGKRDTERTLRTGEWRGQGRREMGGRVRREGEDTCLHD